jgi:hypothetical protein
MKGYKARVYDRRVVLGMVVMDVLRTFLRAVPGVGVKEALDVLIYEKAEMAVRRYVGEDVEVGLGDSGIHGVVEDVSGIWVKLKARVGRDELEYLIPVFSIKYIRRPVPASQGNRR